MPKEVIQDQRSIKLYGDDPVIIPESEHDKVLQRFRECFDESDKWFQANYESDFVRFLANYRSISGNVVKPWNDANEYFMPSTNITIENYVARSMETVRGGRDFVTVYPRGRDDEIKAKMVQLYLRYMFEQPMKGYQRLVDVFRTKFIYGTSIASMPWNIDIQKQRLPGKYIWDSESEDWVREIPEESGVQGEKPPPKDFSGVDISAFLKDNKNLTIKDLYKDVRMKDCPDLEIQDIFNVKVDPNGGPDIQKHAYTIIESIETLNTIRRKADQGVYDRDQVDKLIAWYGESEHSEDESDDNEAIRNRDSVEGFTRESGVKNGVRIWTVYAKYDIQDDGYEEEIVAIIAAKDFLLRFVQTPFRCYGIPYRPLLVDRFISLPHRFYGIGISEILENLNFLLNHLVNQILNHGDLMNSPPLIVPQEGQWEPSHSIFGAGQVWFSDNADGFQILSTPDIKGSQIQMITFIEGFIQKSLGVNDFTLGGGSGGIVKNQTAHGLANILRETNRRVDFYAQNTHENFVKEMYEMILKESQSFMDKQEIPRITDIGKDGAEFEFKEVFNKDIQGMYDLKIYADSLTANKEFEQVKSQNFVQILSQITDPMTQAPLYDMQKVGDKFIESYQEPFPEYYHAKPPQEAQGMGGMPGGTPVPQEGQEVKPVPTGGEAAQPEGRLGPI